MLQPNCRVENFNGTRFYEKDILYDNYVFTHDIELTIDVTYISPGFGITLMDNEGYSVKEKNSSYLFKVGYKEASIYYSDGMNKTLIKQITCPYATTIQDHMMFFLKKSGKKITVKLNNQIIFEEYIKKELDKYNVGYYSNAGNIINNISMASNIPDSWVVNMKNTQGGYINFSTDSFALTDCKNVAEIEQQKINLKKGKYYLKLLKEDINGINDIQVYVEESNNDLYFDDEKNILDPEDNSFKLLEDKEINLKFVGKQGKISNIIITENPEDDYIPTTTDILNFTGSSIDVFLQDLKKITWKGCVSRYPRDKYQMNIIYGLILDNRIKIRPQDTNILLGNDKNKFSYDYEFNAETFFFTIKKDGVLVYEKKLTNFTNKITIFKNISAVITEMILYKKNGNIINVNIQDENKKYINANINGPILVVDEYDSPLDISSSYRKSINNNNFNYIFTNWEREYFKPARKIKLTNKVINKDDSIIIYGIRKNADVNFERFFDVPDDNINSIDYFCKEYDYIRENDILYIDKIQNMLFFNKEQISQYDYIIVDYLKDNSYCINLNYEKNSYEVNISSLLKNNKILYNSQLIDSNTKKITQINKDKITNIHGNITGYIVLQKGGTK